jgi:TM2 domain-containing membrane protein YozV
MTLSIGDARTYGDLLQAGDDGPYLFSRIFADQGWRSGARCEKKFKLLRRIEPVLTPMLREGERVFFLTQGVASLSLLEWYFLGAVLYYLNRRAIVLTTERMLLLQINSRGKPRELRSQIVWQAIARLTSTLLGNTKVEFRSGRRILLTGVPRADRKWLKTVMNDVIAKLESKSDLLELEHLCPHCYQPIALGPIRCPRCSGPLKSPGKAALLSFIFPGAGDFYLGHWGFATLEVLISAMLWLIIIAAAVDPMVGVPDVLVVIVAFVLVGHGLDALTTRHIALKGAYPASGRSDAWRSVTAAALPGLTLVTLLLSAGCKPNLRPADTAVPGNEVAPDHIAALRGADVIGPQETIRFFYSHSPLSVLDDGNLFTDDRIVSYGRAGDSLEYYSAAFTQVVDLHLAASTVPGEPSLIYVVPERDLAFFLLAPSERQGAEAFMQALTDRWRTVRISLDSGVWFDGGVGSDPEDAIVLRGVSSPESIEAAERWWLTLWLGEEDVAWRITNRTRFTDAGRSIDELTVRGPDGESAEFLFDAGPAGPGR